MEDYFKNHKDVLETRIRTYNDLSRSGRRVQNLGILLVLGGMAAMFFVFYVSKNSILGGSVTILLFLGAIGISFLGRRMILSKGVPVFYELYLSSDEKIFLKVYDAWTSLASYVHEGLEPARHQCLRYLRETYVLLNEYWKMGDVKVVMEEIGGELNKFRKAFESRLIYTLEHRTKKEQGDTVFFVLTEFGQFLIEPTKSRLVQMNGDIEDFQKRGTLLFTDKPSLKYPIFETLKRHDIHKHVVVVGIISAVSLVAPVFLLYSGEINADAALIAFSTVFGPLIAVYLAYVLNRR